MLDQYSASLAYGNRKIPRKLCTDFLQTACQAGLPRKVVSDPASMPFAMIEAQ